MRTFVISLMCFLLLVLCASCGDANTVDMGCIKPQLLGYSTEKSSSSVALLFYVEDCKGNPVPNLSAEKFLVTEDDKKLSVEAAKTILNRRGLVMYITLLLDMSSSTQPSLGELVSGAEAFVDELLVVKKLKVKIAIHLFSGESEIARWQTWTSDVQSLKSKLQDLKNYKSSDPGSTNLNGALSASSSATQNQAKAVFTRSRGGAFGRGVMVLFTDGTDTAGRLAKEQAISALKETMMPVLAVGLNNSEDYDEEVLKEYATTGLISTQDATQLKATFTQMAEKISNMLQATYLLGFCSTKRAGSHEVGLKLDGAANKENNVTFQFDANGFAAGCNAAYFADSCQSKLCGGLVCGACDDDNKVCAPDTFACK